MQNQIPIDKFKDGDIRELENIIDILSQNLMKYCHNILCDYQESEDVLQNVFIKAFEKRNLYNQNVSFKAWIYRIAYNSCIDVIRRRKLKFLPLSNSIVYSESKIDDFSEKTLAVLSKLKADERGILFNRIIDEMSFSEISKIYSIKEESARKRFERAKKKFVMHFDSIEKKCGDKYNLYGKENY